jgi:excinuclease ABC subunit B
VLVGVNLLREGLDIPEVSLVAILDADKEGFLRSHRSLTQTAGRAARNVNGLVIMYAQHITSSMRLTIEETNRRREKQLKYNAQHGIVPKQIQKVINNTEWMGNKKTEGKVYTLPDNSVKLAAESLVTYNTNGKVFSSDISNTERIEDLKKMMKKAAKEFDFVTAASLRDEILRLEAMNN